MAASRSNSSHLASTASLGRVSVSHQAECRDGFVSPAVPLEVAQQLADLGNFQQALGSCSSASLAPTDARV